MHRCTNDSCHTHLQRHGIEEVAVGINVRRVADGGRGDYRFPYGRTVDEMKTPEFEAKMKAGTVGNKSILPVAT